MNYFKKYAEALGSNLSSVNSITQFTKNPDVIGQYAEKVVRNLLKDCIDPLKISSGTIIGPKFKTGFTLPQIDLILWDANPLPPIFKLDDFALVPQNSVAGILEIKKTDYSQGIDDIEKGYKSSKILLPNFSKDSFFGIICVLDKLKPNGNNKYTKLRKTTKNKVTYLLEKNNDGYRVNYRGVFEFINFIGTVKKKNKDIGKEFFVNLGKVDE